MKLLISIVLRLSPSRVHQKNIFSSVGEGDPLERTLGINIYIYNSTWVYEQRIKEHGLEM